MTKSNSQVNYDRDWKSPLGRYQIEPEEAIQMDNILEQIQYRHVLMLKANGELMLAYRQKQQGDLCPCVDINRGQALSNCRVCYGTKFVGGYEYLGKILMRFAPAPMSRVITELGLVPNNKPQLWTMAQPVLQNRDVLIAKMQMPEPTIITVVDEPVVRGNVSATDDGLRRINVVEILNISDKKNTHSDYHRNTDYILTAGQVVLTDSAATPSTGTTTSRTFRVLGTYSQIEYPDYEYSGKLEVEGRTINVNTDGAKVGDVVTIVNTISEPQSFTATVATAAVGTPDAGYLIVTITGTNLGNSVSMPVSGFLGTVNGDIIRWVSGGAKPTTSAVYYVTYKFVLTYTRRYQIQDLTVNTWRGVPMHQKMSAELFEPSHIIYSMGSAFDNGTIISRGSSMNHGSIEDPEQKSFLPIEDAMLTQIKIDSGLNVNETDPRYSDE